jgi:ABC-type bacteriocin/lantibiotic exporter with double-glycine peptidase domain
MPKVHKIGTHRFTQLIDFPVKWGWKLAVRGWTQEIDEPYRTATPLIVRLPFHKAVVFGKWTGELDEETALNNAMQGRVLSDEDFEEGWQPPAYQTAEESSWDLYS